MTKKIDKDGEFRLRPNRPTRGGKNEAFAWSAALKTVFRYASTSARRSRLLTNRSPRSRKQFNQRCAVRITYTKNKVAGQWRAHGRYIARETASKYGVAGFNAGSEAVEPDQILDRWQKHGDARLWKFIISPEFGDRVDLQRLTRELMQRMETDLGTTLEWVAVSHFNTEHPHVHVALRGIRNDGSVLDLRRDYVKSGMRAIAEDLCTRQLGYRTELDAREAERREVDQCRATSLDRIVQRANESEGSSEITDYFQFQPARACAKRDQVRHLEARLCVLQTMDLATPTEPGNWAVRSDFLTVLKAMQQVTDRQKTLAAHRVLISDERLPFVVTEQRSIKHLEGRVLGHGEDESGKNFGRHYMLLEGTDAKIHLLYYTPELEESRSRGQLGTNSFVTLRKRFENGRAMLQVENLGDADKLLQNTKFFRDMARRLGNEVIPAAGWGGWLGLYYAELNSASSRITKGTMVEPDR